MARKVGRMRFIILIMLLKQVETLIDKAWCYHTHSYDGVGESVTSVTMGTEFPSEIPKKLQIKGGSSGKMAHIKCLGSRRACDRDRVEGDPREKVWASHGTLQDESQGIEISPILSCRMWTMPT